VCYSDLFAAALLTRGAEACSQDESVSPREVATTEIYTLSLHDALPICSRCWP